MDDFAQKMLERAKLRRQKLNSHISSQAGISSRPLQENIDPNIEVKSSLSTSAKTKLQQLGDLYSDNCENLSSPIHKAEDKILESASKNNQPKCRIGRLNDLASTINQWEDDLSHPDLKKKPEPTKPGVTKLTKTESKLTETTTTILMTTINKSKQGDEIKETTATIVAGMNAKKQKLNGGVEKNVDADSCEKNENCVVSGDLEKLLDSPQTILSSGTYRKSPSKALKPAVPHQKGPAPPAPKISNTYKKEKAPQPPKPPVHPSTASPIRRMSNSPALQTNASPIKRVNNSPTIKTAASPLKRVANSPAKSPKMGVSALDKDSTVLKRAAMFEKKLNLSPLKPKDPTELSLSERKALFEKNKGEVLLPKVAFATSLPANLRKSPTKPVSAPLPKIIDVPKPAVVKFKEKLPTNMVETTNINLSKLERDKELEALKNRWNKNKGAVPQVMAPPVQPFSEVKSTRAQGQTTPPEMTSPRVQEKKTPPQVTSPCVQAYKDSPEALKVVKDVKKIVLSPPKKGKLYPSLSDIEAEDSECSSEGSSPSSHNHSKDSNIYLNMSFGDILEASKKNSLTPTKRESSVLNEMDEFLDAALGDVSSSPAASTESGDGPTPPKKQCATKASDSFEFGHQSPKKPMTPLIHTVSFYRKEQSSLSTPNHGTPMKVVKRNEIMEHASDSDEPVDETAAVTLKISELTSEVAKQQTIISQASNYLSVCLSSVEFTGSGEQVEGERTLLLASHKRQACINELNRLNVEWRVRPGGSNCENLNEQGDLVISNIVIPLKRDTLHSMAADESMEYFVCLVKSNEKVCATPVVSASPSNLRGTELHVPAEVRLEKLYSDFKVTVEVYHMLLSKELLPHHIKYHLPGTKKDKKLLTPSKNKTKSRLIMPSIQSPAGPNAVRTTNFQLCGFVVFSLRDVKRPQWTLNQVPYTSPVEGSIRMSIKSSLQLDDEFRGFLNIFDDVSGLGAWHRRWCCLSAHTLSFWKYPDDENKKVPLDSLDLRTVITEHVGIVSRDICARLHTFLMETTRPRQPQDRESLVLVLQGEVARIRHLLSADTKEERIEWCNRLNKALSLLRAWNCHG